MFGFVCKSWRTWNCGQNHRRARRPDGYFCKVASRRWNYSWSLLTQVGLDNWCFAELHLVWYVRLYSIKYFNSHAIGLNTSRDRIFPSLNWGLKLGNIRARVEKKIWRITNSKGSTFGENMLGYLSLDINCSSYLTGKQLATRKR